MFTSKEMTNYFGLNQSSVVSGDPKPQDLCPTMSFFHNIGQLLWHQKPIRDQPQADVRWALRSRTDASLSGTSKRPALHGVDSGEASTVLTTLSALKFPQPTTHHLHPYFLIFLHVTQVTVPHL
ncbi:unnamed protein product [Heterobilharzia americana]|nr:unnamed protein product [Heterobilharzia americana]